MAIGDTQTFTVKYSPGDITTTGENHEASIAFTVEWLDDDDLPQEEEFTYTLKGSSVKHTIPNNAVSNITANLSDSELNLNTFATENIDNPQYTGTPTFAIEGVTSSIISLDDTDLNNVLLTYDNIGFAQLNITYPATAEYDTKTTSVLVTVSNRENNPADFDLSGLTATYGDLNNKVVIEDYFTGVPVGYDGTISVEALPSSNDVGTLAPDAGNNNKETFTYNNAGSVEIEVIFSQTDTYNEKIIRQTLTVGKKQIRPVISNGINNLKYNPQARDLNNYLSFEDASNDPYFGFTGSATFSNITSDTDLTITNDTDALFEIAKSGYVIEVSIDDRNHEIATANKDVTITVDKADLVITFNNASTTITPGSNSDEITLSDYDSFSDDNHNGTITYTEVDGDNSSTPPPPANDLIDITGIDSDIADPLKGGETWVMVTMTNSDRYEDADAWAKIEIGKAENPVTFNIPTGPYTYGDLDNTLDLTTGLNLFDYDGTPEFYVEPDTGAPGNPNSNHVASISGTVLTYTNAGHTVVKVDLPATDIFKSAVIRRTLTVDKATPTVQFQNFNKTYGDPQFSLLEQISNLPTDYSGTISFTNTNNFNGTNGTVSLSGSNDHLATVGDVGEVRLTVHLAEDANYNARDVNATLEIQKATPTLVFDNFTKKYKYGDNTFDLEDYAYVDEINPGTITFQVEEDFDDAIDLTGSIVTVKRSGVVKLRMNVATTDSYSAHHKIAELTVDRDFPAVTFNDFEALVLDEIELDDLITVPDDYSKANITYSVNNGTGTAELNGIDNSLLETLTTGTVSVTASLAQTDKYDMRVVSATVDIVKRPAPYSISFPDFSRAYGTNPLDLRNKVIVTGDGTLFRSQQIAVSHGMDMTLQTDSYEFSKVDNGNQVVSLSGAYNQTATINKVGVITLEFKINANDYFEEVKVTSNMTVNQISPSITFDNFQKTYGDEDFNLFDHLSVPSDYTGTIEFFDDGGTGSILLSGDSDADVEITGAGHVDIRVALGGDHNYEANNKTARLTIHKADLIPADIFSDFTKTFNDPDFNLDNRLNLPDDYTGAPTYSKATQNPLLGDVALTGDRMQHAELLVSGTIELTANIPHDDNYNSTTATATLTINKDDPVVTFGNIDKTYNDPNFELEATTNAPEPITYQVVSGSEYVALYINPSEPQKTYVSIRGAGTAVIKAVSEEGIINYNEGSATATITISKDDPAILFDNFTKVYGDEPFSLEDDTVLPSDYDGTFTYEKTDTNNTVAQLGGTNNSIVTIERAGAVNFKIVLSGDANYNPAHKVATMTVDRATPTVGFNIPPVTIGDQDLDLNNYIQPPGDYDGKVTYQIEASRDGGAVTLGGPNNEDLTIVQAGEVDIKATFNTDGKYSTASSVSTIVISKAATGITFAIADKTYGDEDFTLEAMSMPAGAEFEYEVVPGGTGDVRLYGDDNEFVEILGAGTVTIRAKALERTNYLPNFEDVTFTIFKADPTIDFQDQAVTYDPNQLFELQAGSVPEGVIDFALTGGTGAIVLEGDRNQFFTVLQAGYVDLTATFEETANFNSGTANAKLTIHKAEPVITFDDIQKTFDDDDFELEATAVSPGDITYSVENGTGAVSLYGDYNKEVRLVKAGNVTIRASIASTVNYKAGVADAELIINKADPLLVTDDADKTYGDVPFELFTVSRSDGDVTYSIDSGEEVISLDGNLVTILQSGVATIATRIEETDNYTSGLAFSTVRVEKAISTIDNFFNIVSTYGDAPFDLDATTNSDGVIRYVLESGDDVVSLNGNEITLLKSGTAMVKAYVQETDKYFASEKIITIEVLRATAVITNFNDLTNTYGDAPVTLTAGTNSDGSLSYSVVSGDDVISLDGAVVTFLKSGVAYIKATVPETDKFLSVERVIKVDVKRAFPKILNFADITATYLDRPVTLDATTNSDSPINYALTSGDDVISLDGPTFTTLKSGTATITASVNETEKYYAGELTITVTVQTARAWIQNIEDMTVKYDSPIFTYEATSNSDGTVLYELLSGSDVINLKDGKVTTLKAGTATVKAYVNDTERFESASRVVTVTVERAVTVIENFDNLVKTVDDPAFILTASSNSDAPISYAKVIDNGVIALEGNKVIIKSPGIAYVKASVPENDKFEAGEKVIAIQVNTVTDVTAAKAQSITVYPVPSDGEVNVEWDGHIDAIVVYDLKGNMVFNADGKGAENKVELNLASGMYVLKAKAGDNTFVKRISIK
ncbi:T9SS type A sorting domain-containing protein [Fulvitalea axinellae]